MNGPITPLELLCVIIITVGGLIGLLHALFFIAWGICWAIDELERWWLRP